MRLTLCALALCSIAPFATAGDQEVLVDFESGTLGWSGPAGSTGGTAIVPSGGKDGGAGLRTIFNDFFITYENSVNPAFVGDWSQYESVTLSVDLKVNKVEFFFSPVSRPWLVELRDYDSAQGGYPWSSVWFKFADVSSVTHGDWTTFSVTINDPDSTTLPPGWKGYGADDPATFEPILPVGVTFADILAGVDEMVFTTGEPGWFFGFTDFDFVLDNISIQTSGGPWSDLGNGLAGVAGEPRLFGAGSLAPGSPTSIDLTNAPASSPSFLAVGSARVDLPFYGGVLVPSADVAVLPLQTDPSGNLQFDLNWPASLPAGATFYWQHWLIDFTGPQGLIASNGLESRQ